ncbi:hypothetical protein D3C71_1430290 [compost metagenome]
MLRLTDCDHRLFRQRRGGTGLHAGAAGDAFGFKKMFVRTGRDTTFETAPLDRQCERALHFLACTHAARTDDAFRRVIGEIGVGFVLRHPFRVDGTVVARAYMIVTLVAVTNVA